MTVDAFYRAGLTAKQLADQIVIYDCSAFAFLMGVSPTLQYAFVEALRLDTEVVAIVAKGFAELAGYDLALAV